MVSKGIINDLSTIAGNSQVSTSRIDREVYGHDLAPIPKLVRKFFKTLPDLIIRPRSPDVIPEIIAYAGAKRIPIIPRGAATWAYGGAVPIKGGLVLDLTGLNRVSQLDVANGLVTVESGSSWKMLQTALAKQNMWCPVYPTSSPSSTIGGWVATGGLGIGSLKYGPVQQNIKELEVITPSTGTQMVPQNKTASEPYTVDWFCGSEGTLGAITKVTLSIKHQPEYILPLTVGFNNTEQMCTAINEGVHGFDELYNIQFLDEGYLKIKQSLGLDTPTSSSIVNFVFEGAQGAVEKDERRLRSLFSNSNGDVQKTQISHEEWEDRFYPMRIKRAGPTLLAGDVLIPINQLLEFINEMHDLEEKYELVMGIEGTVVSKTMALVMPMFPMDERKSWQFLVRMALVKEINDRALKIGGQPYGGFGVWNSFNLKNVKTKREIEEMKQRKKMLDPDNIMNPGKIYRVPTRFGLPFTPRLYGLTMALFKTIGLRLW